MKMGLNYIAILCVLLPTALFGQENSPTAAEKCRFVTPADLSDARAPSFGSYPARPQEVPSSIKLDLRSNPIAKKYRTVLRQEIAKGPNYAGHYRVAVWGCGISCAMFAVVNLETGTVISAREIATVLGTHLDADEFLSGTRSDYWGFRFKNDSSLLVVLGAPDEDESRAGAYYFALQGERLRLIHTTRVSKTCEEVKP
ncbi:MAG: hypothetical protein WCA19_23075 [Candidatus Acidiferrales bacterium]